MNRWVKTDQDHDIVICCRDLMASCSTREEVKSAVQKLVWVCADVLDAIVLEEEEERDQEIATATLQLYLNKSQNR